MRDYRRVAPWLVIVCLAAAPFVNGLDNAFVYDDHAQVTRNALVRSLDPRPILAGGAVTHGHVEWYRPLTIYSLAVNWAIAGNRPRLYHVANVALHAANACLVLSVALALFGRLGPAMVAATLFAVHAVHAEAVTPVFGRADLLASFFVLVGWRLALASGAHARWRAAAVAGCALAGLLAKENAIALIPLVVFSDMFLAGGAQGPLGQRVAAIVGKRRILYLALLAASIVYVAVRVAAIGGLQADQSVIRDIENPLVTATLRDRLLTASWVVVFYVRLFLVPHPLRADYSYNQIPVIDSWADPRVAAILVIVVLMAAAIIWQRAARVLVPHLGVFALLLLPVSNVVVPIGTIMAERLLYLPSVALCLLVALAVSPWLMRGRATSRAAVLAVGVLAAIHTWLAISRNGDWRNDETLFAQTVRVSPRSAKARVTHATILLEHGDATRAEPLLASALSIAPGYPEAHNLLGTVYLGRGELPRAEGAFRAALRNAPDYAPALGNLGITLRRMGRPDEATQLLRRAIARDPSLAIAVVNLALLAEMRGDRGEASSLYSRAYALDPSLEVARVRAKELSSGGSPRN